MPQFPGRIVSKLPKVGTTIFTVMSGLAAEHNAINLSQGFPDFDCAKPLRDLLVKYVNSGLNQYAPMAGVMRLRERIAEKVAALYGASYDPGHEVTVVPGATYGIFTAVATLIRPGDEVMLFEPAYDSYAPAVEAAGGVPVYVQLRYPDYSIDWREAQQAITPKTRMLIINTPNNPTASVWSGEDMRMLEGMLRGTDIVVVSDEVYEHIVFDGHRHQSAARFPGLAERTYIVSSFGKTYHVTGWKTGYVLAPRELMAEFRKVHQFNAFVTNSPVQHALAEYMENRDAYLALAAFYQKKRDFFLEGIRASRFKPLPSRGTFFQNLCYDAVSEERDTDLAVRLTKERGVASIPISVFYREPPPHRVLRFCFAKSDDTLAKGAEILSKI
ncbi:MAG: aminotransferase class I/II-fold pyridoxal phosphate-dependent enzyme [Betaproteobacteria bacterium]|nr:aminotransferase class I/II-fold pyridoxal phosphate-dependent enzyme [Betaproteobacteria bacterium]